MIITLVRSRKGGDGLRYDTKEKSDRRAAEMKCVTGRIIE